MCFVSPVPSAVLNDTTNSIAKEALPEFRVTHASIGMSSSATAFVVGTENTAAEGHV